MNLKKRLSSTEDLLRAIRSSKPYTSPSSTPPSPASPQDDAERSSVWTREISLAGLFHRRKTKKSQQQDRRRPAARPPQASDSRGPAGSAAQKLIRTLDSATQRLSEASKQPFWRRPLRFGRALSLRLGLSRTGDDLCCALLQLPQKTLLKGRRFPMRPSQAPGEQDFSEFLHGCLDHMLQETQEAEIWVMLQSSDLDLNVLSVPKLSGPKLDATVYWTLQKEKKFADAEYILDYLVMGPDETAKTPHLEILTCLARRSDVERVRDAFRDADVPLAGVTAIPNAFLNLYALPDAPKGHVLAANLHVEQSFSTIGLYAGKRLLFSRIIRSGTESMAEAIEDHYKTLAQTSGPDVELELPAPGEAPRRHAAPPPNTRQCLELFRYAFFGAPQPKFALPEHLLPPEEMLKLVAPAVDRLARQVERTLAYFASNQHKTCDAMHASGEFFGSPLLAQALRKQLVLPLTRFDVTTMLPEGGENVAEADRMVLAPAVAAALTPAGCGVNFLNTYKERRATATKRLLNQALLAGLAAVLLLLFAAGFVLERSNAARRTALAAEELRLAKLGPQPDPKSLQASLALFTAQQNGLRQSVRRNLLPAVLSELSRRIPTNVELISITSDFAASAPPKAKAPGKAGASKAGAAKPPAPAAATKPQKTPATGDVIQVEGIISGDQDQLDATLSRLVMSLQSSPLFSLPLVSQSELRDMSDRKDPVLYFALRIGVR